MKSKRKSKDSKRPSSKSKRKYKDSKRPKTRDYVIRQKPRLSNLKNPMTWEVIVSTSVRRMIKVWMRSKPRK